MKHHKAFEIVTNFAPDGAYVSVSKEIIRSNTGEILTEWSVYVRSDVDAYLGTGETFDGAYNAFLSEWEEGEE